MTGGYTATDPGRAARALGRKLVTHGGGAAEWFGYGELLVRTRRYSEAEEAFRHALKTAPENTAYLRALAAALSGQRRFGEAIAIRQALPNRNAHDIAALADDLKYDHRLEAAIAAVDEAEAADRMVPHAKVVRGQAKLFLKDYRAGFEDMEARFDAGMSRIPDQIDLPRWGGALTRGLRLLVVPDQGLGDDLMMLRFVRRLHAAGRSLTFVARPALTRLLGASGTGARIVATLPDTAGFDAWCPINSLPHATRFRGQPPPPARLSAPPEARDRGQGIAAPYRDALKIGLCWTGNPRFPRNDMRSLSPDEFEALGRRQGLALFSLCKGDGVEHLRRSKMAGRILDVSSNDADLADTAGLIEALDLVISSDTVIVHLAASLEKPVWTLLPHESFWQYGIEGDRTPWYPTMRLFRQEKPGDWGSVLAAVTSALESWPHASSGAT